jgi:hypothetical protein
MRVLITGAGRLRNRLPRLFSQTHAVEALGKSELDVTPIAIAFPG